MTLPTGIPLLAWAAAMVIDFPTDNVGILLDESNWKRWGGSLVQEISFSENNAPSPINYSDWFPWAMDVFYTMQNLV